ncbi:hypothetical protein EON82_00990 [bacterium]|nr:MAG: hypothetical protein EON82_00990 [bacterium]
MLVTLVILQATVRLSGNEVTEASGLVASSTQPGILWLNNDSGDGAYLYAFDTKGRQRATVAIRGAFALDWEDLAYGPFPGKNGTWLYAGDIGDNLKFRNEITVYAIPEPKVRPSSKEAPIVSQLSIKLPAKYPDGKHNAETLLCDPRDGRLTIVTKEPNGVSGVYRFPATPKPNVVSTLIKVGEFRVPAGGSKLVTGGSFRPDGSGVALVTYSHLYELKGREFWKAKPQERPLTMLRQCETVAYSADGRSIWLTSEGEKPPLLTMPAE